MISTWVYFILGVIILAIVIFCVLRMSSCARCNSNTQRRSENFESQDQLPTAIPSSSGIQSDITLYYATWCGFCKQMLPEWEKFEDYARKNFTHLRVDKVRCEDGNEAVCRQKGVQGYPTIILTNTNGTQKLFDGERSLNGLINFCNNN